VALRDNKSGLIVETPINRNQSSFGSKSTGTTTQQPSQQDAQPTSPDNQTQTPSQSDRNKERAGVVINAQAADDLIDRTLNLGSTPNVLNNSFNSTYNFTLFMTNETDLLTTLGTDNITVTEMQSRLENLKRVVIAQTGVTGFNIKDVTIKNIVAPNSESRSTNTTGITIEIVEPLGTSFLDTIKNSAIELGVQNWQKMWYYLELSFIGYDEDGYIVDPVYDMFLPNGGRWIWQIQITDIDTRFDSGGSEYTITAIPMDETALASEYQKIKDHVKVEATNIGEYWDNLADALNTSWRLRYGDDIVSFKFKAHNIRFHGKEYSARDIRNFSLIPNAPELNSIQSAPLDGRRGIAAEAARDTNIIDLVEYAFVNCEKAQNLGLDRSTRQGSTETTENFRESIIFRVEPEVRVTGYDIISNQYVKEITYHVFGYATQSVILDRQDVLNAENDDVQRSMIKRLVDHGFLRKRYDYLFTGMNTEITGLDVRFNFAWNAVLPRLKGWNYTLESVEAHSRIDPLLKQARNTQRSLADLTSEISDLQDEQREIQGIPIGKRTEEQTARLSQLPQLIQDNSDTREFLLGQFHWEKTQTTKLTEEYRKKQAERDTTETNIVYAETLTGVPESVPLMISFEQGGEEARDATGVGFRPQYHRDMSVYGAILDQLYAPMTKQMMTIDIEINGDPYWIGAGNFEHRANLAMNEIPVLAKDAVVANYSEGDNTFLLTFKMPYNLGDDSRSVIRQRDTFNGVYRVTEVTNVFSGGVFKQTLHANRLPLIDIFKAMGVSSIGDGFTYDSNYNGAPR